MQIEFSTNQFTSADVRDVMDFTKVVSSDWTLTNNYAKLCATKYEETPHEDLMTTVTITFQCWKKFPKYWEKGLGTRYVMTIYRAKDHCCSNISFEQKLWTLGELAKADVI